jgi:hypothetical protein
MKNIIAKKHSVFRNFLLHSFRFAYCLSVAASAIVAVAFLAAQQLPDLVSPDDASAIASFLAEQQPAGFTSPEQPVATAAVFSDAALQPVAAAAVFSDVALQPVAAVAVFFDAAQQPVAAVAVFSDAALQPVAAAAVFSDAAQQPVFFSAVAVIGVSSPEAVTVTFSGSSALKIVRAFNENAHRVATRATDRNFIFIQSFY